MKRSPLRRQSLKRAALMREAGPAREAYLEQFPLCMVPWCGNRSVDVHEILRGCYREVALSERAALLALCRACHDQFGSAAKWPVARQCALKLLVTPDEFDRERLCEILAGKNGRPRPNAISCRDISEWLLLKDC